MAEQALRPTRRAGSSTRPLGGDKLTLQTPRGRWRASRAATPKVAPYEGIIRLVARGQHGRRATSKTTCRRYYSTTFTDKELKDIIAFLKTPTGQKVVAQMPGLVQHGANLSGVDAWSRTGRTSKRRSASARPPDEDVRVAVGESPTGPGRAAISLGRESRRRRHLDPRRGTGRARRRLLRAARGAPLHALRGVRGARRDVPHAALRRAPYDRGAHRFHDRDPEITQDLLDLMG